MRVALAGKGGAGKTTVAATLARLAARAGRRVVCIDADSNPNLAVALGIPPETVPAALPASLVSRRFDGPTLTSSLEEVLSQHAVVGPDGLHLALMGMPGHAEEGCMCSAHATVSSTLAELGGSDLLSVVDLEASPEHLSRGTARHVDVLLLVAEPYYRSLETTRRMAELAAELPIPRVGVVANKLRDEVDRDAVAGFCERHGLRLVGQVPWADDVLDADREGVPLAEARPDGPPVRAVQRLLDDLQDIPAASPGRAHGQGLGGQW